MSKAQSSRVGFQKLSECLCNVGFVELVTLLNRVRMQN